MVLGGACTCKVKKMLHFTTVDSREKYCMHALSHADAFQAMACTQDADSVDELICV